MDNNDQNRKSVESSLDKSTETRTKAGLREDLLRQAEVGQGIEPSTPKPGPE